MTLQLWQKTRTLSLSMKTVRTFWRWLWRFRLCEHHGHSAFWIGFESDGTSTPHSARTSAGDNIVDPPIKLLLGQLPLGIHRIDCCVASVAVSTLQCALKLVVPQKEI